MEIENKLDEDFIFYLGFANTFIKHVPDGDIKAKCQAGVPLIRAFF